MLHCEDFKFKSSLWKLYTTFKNNNTQFYITNIHVSSLLIGNHHKMCDNFTNTHKSPPQNEGIIYCIGKRISNTSNAVMLFSSHNFNVEIYINRIEIKIFLVISSLRGCKFVLPNNLRKLWPKLVLSSKLEFDPMKNYFLNTKSQNIIERSIVLNPGKRWQMKFEPLFQ